MPYKRFRRTIKVAGATIAAAGLMVAIAAAAVTTIETDSSTQTPNAAATARATCGLAKYVVGGGFALDPSYDPISGNGAHAQVQQSFPPNRKAWRARSYAIAGGTDSTLYSIALCRHVKPTREVNGFSIAPATDLTVLAKCGRKKWHVIGGGFKISPAYDPGTATGANVSVNTNQRVSDVYWRVRAVRDSGDDATVRAFALCVRDRGNGKIVTVHKSVDVPDVGTYTATAHCHGLTKVVSGGFKVRPVGTPGSSMATGLFPWVTISAPLLSKDGWTATMQNTYGPVPDGKLTVYAYCQTP